MAANIYREAIQQTACAFAYHRAVFDESRRMIDYLFLDVNQSFEQSTGLSKEAIINHRFVRDAAKDKAHALTWVERYRPVVEDKKTIEFEAHSAEFNRYFWVRAFPAEEDCFVTLFLDKTFEKKMQEIAQYFIDNMGSHIDYDKVTVLAHDISGADYTAFNLIAHDGESFKTVSVAGEPADIKRASELMELGLPGRKWKQDPVKDEIIRGQKLAVFDNLQDLVGGVIPEETIRQMEDLFDIGQVVVAAIAKGENILGDFTLLFRKGHELQNQDLFSLYLAQLGLFIEKSRLERSLRSSQKRFFTLAEQAPVGFAACNLSGRITYANPKLLEILNSPSYEVIKGQNLLDFPELQANGFSDQLMACMENGKQSTFEMPYESIWGSRSWIRVSLTPNMEEEAVIGASMVVDDITDKKLEEVILQEKAHRDALTGTYNRYALETILSERLNVARDQSLISCVAVLDIDDFKAINDRHGHWAGDSVLKYLATRVKQVLRTDDLIVRTGGDEFLIYLHDIGDESNAGPLIERVFEKVSADYLLEDPLNDRRFSLKVFCSIGASFFPRQGDTLEALNGKADEALYKAKKSGKAKYRMAD